MVAHLDTRKERPLTSREIAKIFGGFIGGAVRSGMDPGDLLAMFRAGRDLLLTGDPGNRTAVEASDSSRAVAGSIGGMIGGLLQWCQAGQVVTAIEWVCDHWVELVTAVVAEDARTCARGQA